MINVYDLETYEENGEIVPYCAAFKINEQTGHVYYENEKNLIIESLDNIIKIKNQDKYVIYVHNLNFDGYLIISVLSKNKIDFQTFKRKLNLYWLKFNFLGKDFEFRCSYKILPLSLNSISKIDKNQKLLFPYRFVSKKTLNYLGNKPSIEYYNEITLNEYENEEEILDLKQKTINYCLKDVEITYNFLLNIKKVLKEVGTSLLSNSYSAPSIAIKVFFKKFNSMKIEPKIKLVEEKYIRNSYFGGRTEVFGNPKSGELIHYFDFSGMYGQCMLEKFPIQIKEFKFENLNLSEIGFHTIEYESDSYIPILPTKNNFDSKLMFKNGKQKGTYWYEEINFFLKNGGKINKHISSLVYDGYDNIFSNYVNFFTNLRKKDGYYKVFGKLMINSLYGGFGLRSDNGFTIITFSQIEFDYILKNFDISSYTKLNDCFIMDIILNFKSENYFNQKKKWENLELSLSERNLTYASIIASKARIKLNKALLQTINNGGRLYYCDTDSIFAGYKKSRINLNEGEITWLKTYKDAVFASPKCYALLGEEADIKIKGIRTTYKNFEDFKNKFYTGSGILFKNELQINKKNMQLTQKYIEKNINLANYTKRIFDIDKKNTFPIKVVEQDPDI